MALRPRPNGDTDAPVGGVRIPRSAECARVLYDLATHLIRDAEFRSIAQECSTATTGRKSNLVRTARERLGLPADPWALGYVKQLLARTVKSPPNDERSMMRALVGIVHHPRIALEFVLNSKRGEERFIVDIDAPRKADVQVIQGDDMTRSVTTLEELEAVSGAPRRARAWWRQHNLPLRRQPNETLRRDTFIFFLVVWRGLTSRDAKLAVADAAKQGHLREHADRGRKLPDDGVRRPAERDLTPASVRKATQRIRTIIG